MSEEFIKSTKKSRINKTQTFYKKIKKASPEKRAKLIEKYRIDSMFDENGDIRADYAQKLDMRIEAGKRGNMSPYVSPARFTRSFARAATSAAEKVHKE